MAWRISTIISLSLLFLTACASEVSNPADFDESIFVNDQFPVTLGFDLRNDDMPMAGLVINAQSATSPVLNTIALPFESSAVEANETLLSTAGSFNETTLVGYYLLSTTSGRFSIGIIPTFPPPPEIYTNPDDTQYSVTLVRMGLERVFVYKYPDTDPYRANWLQNEGALVNTYIDAIGVAYPKDAQGIQIRDTGLTAIPIAFPYRNGKARFYPANSISASNEKALEVKYILSPTQPQKLALEYGLKAITILMPFVAKLIADNSKGKENRKFTYLVVGVQAIVFVWLLVITIRSWGSSSINTIFDLTLVTVSGLITGYGLRQEKMQPKAEGNKIKEATQKLKPPKKPTKKS